MCHRGKKGKKKAIRDEKTGKLKKKMRIIRGAEYKILQIMSRETAGGELQLHQSTIKKVVLNRKTWD